MLNYYRLGNIGSAQLTGIGPNLNFGSILMDKDFCRGAQENSRGHAGPWAVAKVGGPMLEKLILLGWGPICQLVEGEVTGKVTGVGSGQSASNFFSKYGSDNGTSSLTRRELAPPYLVGGGLGGDGVSKLELLAEDFFFF